MTDEAVTAFIARWQGVTGRERANYQLFLTELTAALELPTPDPAEADHESNAYCFERRVTFRHGDGTAPDPLTEDQIAAHFKARGPWRRRLATLLEMLVTLGRARKEDSRYRNLGDAA